MSLTRTASRILLALVLFAVACAPHAPVEKEPGVYESPGGIKFSVKITPLRFAIGEPVALEASLFNGGTHAYHKNFASGCQWDYEVANESGRVVAPARVCAMGESDLHLEPGELRMIMREWKGSDDYFAAGSVLPPGRYSVTAGFVDQHARVVPMSEPVWIEVVAPRTKH